MGVAIEPKTPSEDQLGCTLETISSYNKFKMVNAGQRSTTTCNVKYYAKMDQPTIYIDTRTAAGSANYMYSLVNTRRVPCILFSSGTV